VSGEETTEGLGVPGDGAETELFRDTEVATDNGSTERWQPPPGTWLFGLSAWASVALVVGYILAGGLDYKPDPAPDPCQPRQWTQTERLEDTAEQFALSALDGAACDLGVSRGELARALESPGTLDQFTRDNDFSDAEVEDAIRAGAGRAIDDAENAGVIEPVVALGLRIAVRSLPLAGLIELIQGGGAVLGGTDGAGGLLEDVLRGIEQGQTPNGGFDLGKALEGLFGGSGPGGGSILPEGLEGLLPRDTQSLQEVLKGLFGSP